MSADDTSGILADLLSEAELEREEERKSRGVLEEKIDALAEKVMMLCDELSALQEAAKATPFAVKLGKYRFHLDVTTRDAQERIKGADVLISEAK